MKKTIMCLIAAVTVLSITACGDKNLDDNINQSIEQQPVDSFDDLGSGDDFDGTEGSRESEEDNVLMVRVHIIYKDDDKPSNNSSESSEENDDVTSNGESYENSAESQQNDNIESTQYEESGSNSNNDTGESNDGSILPEYDDILAVRNKELEELVSYIDTLDLSDEDMFGVGFLMMVLDISDSAIENVSRDTIDSMTWDPEDEHYYQDLENSTLYSSPSGVIEAAVESGLKVKYDIISNKIGNAVNEINTRFELNKDWEQEGFWYGFKTKTGFESYAKTYAQDNYKYYFLIIDGSVYACGRSEAEDGMPLDISDIDTIKLLIDAYLQEKNSGESIN